MVRSSDLQMATPSLNFGGGVSNFFCYFLFFSKSNDISEIRKVITCYINMINNHLPSNYRLFYQHVGWFVFPCKKSVRFVVNK